MEDSTVPRAIRNTIECTLREPSIVMNHACGASRGGCATVAFAHRATKELSVKKVLTFACSCDKISFVTEICDMNF